MGIAQRLIDEQVDLSEHEVMQLIDDFCKVYGNMPNVIRVPSDNLVAVGDIHGEYDSIYHVKTKYFHDSDVHIVFLGDYGDRGPQQVQTVNLALAMALAEPSRVTLLRGNHESASIAERYGFYDAIRQSYSTGAFGNYLRAFASLPLAAKSDSGIFYCHGGVPEELTSLDQLNAINRFTPDLDDHMMMQLLWNDPREGGFFFADNIRGTGIRYFGRLAFDKFLEDTGLRLMIRGHEAFPEGFRYFFDEQLVSVFSASYGGSTNPCLLMLHDIEDIRALTIF